MNTINKFLFGTVLMTLGLLAPSALAEITWTRTEVTTENSPYVLEEGKTYTAAPTDECGAVFNVSSGATLTGTNVTFASNTASNEGGAIYNKGKIAFDGAIDFSDNVSSTQDGGAISTSGEVTFTGAATFERNSGHYGGAIGNSGVLKFDSSATFADNKAAGDASAGGAVENYGGTITFADVVTFTNNSADIGGAIYNESTDDTKGVITFAKGATFNGNSASLNAGAICNDGVTINFAGLIDLQTAGDTWYNRANATINWDLTGGLEQYGSISHFERYANENGTIKQLLSVTDDQPAGDYVIATGDFTDITGKDTFTITNVTSGATLEISIDGVGVATGTEVGNTLYRLEKEEDLEAGTTNLVFRILPITCTRTSLAKGQSTNIADKVYTAAPTVMDGGVFYLKTGATLTGTNVKFVENETLENGGAINNYGGTVALKDATFTRNKAMYYGGAINNAGTLSLGGVTFEGNTAVQNGGAICNGGGTVNFDGPVMLVTATDTIYNQGTLNWNLAGGKAGSLGGYQNIICAGSKPKLLLTVEDYAAATNFVIATGDFTDITGKDTFTITNVTSGAAATITIGGITQLNGTWWSLAIEGSDKLVLKTAETVTLSNVMTGVATNASEAVVSVNGQTIEEKAGSYELPKGCEVSVTYTAKDDYMFAGGAKTKSVTVGPLTGNYAMTDADKPTAEAQWVDVRTIAIDTRERIIVGDPSEVLPIAYSTNFWGEATGGKLVGVSVQFNDEDKYTALRDATNENGYCEWMLTPGALGKYTLRHVVVVGPMNFTINSNFVYYSTPFPLTLAAAEAGGAFVAITNGVEMTGTSQVLGFENVTIAAKPEDERWALKEMYALTNGLEVALTEEKSSLTNKFEMPCCETVVTGAFVIAETYRAELADAATNNYLATSNNLEKLRHHRLSDAETDAAIAAARGKLNSAADTIAGVTKPGDGESATNTLATALADVETEARAASDGKPTDFVIASDFSANPPFGDYDAETGTFTWNGQVWTNGVNAFTSFTDAFTNETYGAFATNLHVFGAQTIATEPPMVDTWNLDLITYEESEGVTNAPIVTVGTIYPHAVLVNITNELGAITGEGTIILSKTEDVVNPSIYATFIKGDIDVVNTGVEPKKGFAGNVGFEVNDKAKTETDEETGATAIVLPGVENPDGNYTLVVDSAATNDVLVAGTVKVVGDVTIENKSTNEVTLAGAVKAKDVVINNYGKDGDAEGSILAAEIVATGDVEINNNAHLEANVIADGGITIRNGSFNTIVGTYEGKTVTIEGSKAGAISNVTFVSDGPVALTGVNVLTGPFAIDAPEGAITNKGTLVWNVGGDNTTAHLADFGAIAQGEDAAFGIFVDGEQETNGVNNTYFLAENAAGAWGASFALSGTTFKTNIVVGGEQLYIGQKEYTLTNQADRLVFRIDWGVSDAMRAAYIASVSNDAAQAIADLAAVKTLTPSELEALSEQVEEAMRKAVDDLTTVRKPMDAERILEDFTTAVDDLLTAGDKAAEGMVRFAEHQVEAEGGTEFDLVVYGGSTNRSTAATVNFVKGTWTSKPKATVNGKRVRFPIALNWAKGDREPKVVTLKIPANRKTDRFFALQLGSEVASTVGTPDIVTVTVRGSKGADDAVYVRAFAWPANGGKVAGARKLASKNGKATLQAKANKWSTFAGWYRAKADDPEQIDLENGFVSSDRKIKVSQAEAGTYFAYFTDVLPVIAVNDPDFEDASGIVTNAEGVATCLAGLNVTFSLGFTVAEGDTSGKLTVSKLPKGLKYNRTTGLVTGVPKKAGTYTVRLTGKNKSGRHVLTFDIVVLPMPEALVGTFKGDLIDAAQAVVGSVTLKVADGGLLSAKVKYGRKSVSFTAKGFVENEEYDALLEKKNTGTVRIVIGRDAAGNPDGSYTGIVQGEKFDGQLYFTVR